MPITPTTPNAPKVDVNLREHLSFNPASQETIQRTNLAKSFLEDYYKQMPSRPPTTTTTTKVEEEQPNDIDTKKKITKSSSSRKIKDQKAPSPQITRPFSVMHHAHVGFVKGTGLQVQNLPNELREFVEDLNSSLDHLGAENITEEELKMVLASAKLPSSASAPTPISSSQPSVPRNDEEVIDINEKIDSNMNSIIDTFTPPSSPVHSHSAPSVPSASRTTSSASLSSGVSTPSASPALSSTPSYSSSSQQTPQKRQPPSHPPPPYPDPVTPKTPTTQSPNVGKDANDKGKDNKDNTPQTAGERARATSRTRKFTQFFTDEPPPNKRLSRSLSEASAKPKAESATPSPASPALGGFKQATPKAAKAANFEISSPRNFAKVGGFDFGGESMKDTRVKLELADKALRNESQLRLTAEEKTTGLEKQVTELTLEMEQAKNQAATFSALLNEANAKYAADNTWRKQTDSEINMLRRKIAIKTKSEEDTIASEAKKRRLLEVQIVELKAQQQKSSATTDSSMNKLVADVKAQLASADAELQLVKGQLDDERNRAQEENENQRKELDATKLSFENERKSWIETRLRLEANLETLKAEAQRKVDEVTKQLEDERKQRKVDQMMFETLLKNNTSFDAGTSPSSSPAQSPTQSPAQSPTQSPVTTPQLTATSPPTTSIPPITSPTSDPPKLDTPAMSNESNEMPENPRYSSPLPPGPPARLAPPSTAHTPSTLGHSGGVATKPASSEKKPKAKDGPRKFFRSGKK